MCAATPVGHILSRVLADPNTVEGRDAPWQHRSCGAVRPPLPQCEDLEELERCASKLTVLGELSPNCHLKPAEASKSDIFDIRGISPAFYFLEVPEREKDA